MVDIITAPEYQSCDEMRTVQCTYQTTDKVGRQPVEGVMGLYLCGQGGCSRVPRVHARPLLSNAGKTLGGAVVFGALPGRNPSGSDFSIGS